MRDVIILNKDEVSVLKDIGTKISEITIQKVYEMFQNPYAIKSRTNEALLPGGALSKLGFDNVPSKNVVQYAPEKVKPMGNNVPIDLAVNDTTIIVWEDIKAPPSIGRALIRYNVAKIIIALTSIDGLDVTSKSRHMEVYLNHNS